MVYLNLARKWRPKTFSEVIGQDLTVRLIKNSLYKQQFFPVYLLSGQRGSGKTTLGRLFATAVNCQMLDAFCKNPKTVALPCLNCVSCQAMAEGQHPDFIEIDAASHTGVDNVRQIIETSSFSPLIGSKKIYLIDEAHMLSKAAFNAFLKILEEPPACAIFMLATTDSQKIIDTVKSRCLQLFFTAVPVQLLADHLASICTQERITYDYEALLSIAYEVDGSARDALNAIERIRLTSDSVTMEAISPLQCGLINSSSVMELFEIIGTGSTQAVVEYIAKREYSASSLSLVLSKLTEIIRVALWAKHGVIKNAAMSNYDAMMVTVDRLSIDTLVKLLELCYHTEVACIKGGRARSFIELFFIKCAVLVGTRLENNNPVKQMAKAVPAKVENRPHAHGNLDGSAALDQLGNENSWSRFISAVSGIQEPLVTSVFQQAYYNKDVPLPRVEVSFSRELLFFKELLDETRHVWHPVMNKSFGVETQFKAHFTGGQPTKEQQSVHVKQSVEAVSVATAQMETTKKNKELPLDVSDPEQWPWVSTLLEVFPGIITEIKEAETI
jgi:DNA polymerase III subunit gamma/tau